MSQFTPLTFKRKDKIYQVTLAMPEQMPQLFDFRAQFFVLDENHTNSEVNDRDQFDDICDHLIVTQEDNIIGTYRLLRSDVAHKQGGFYAETEFDLANLQSLRLLEIGRACIHPAHRTSNVISMLWSGLHYYMQTYQLDYIGGCASVPRGTPNLATKIFAYAKQHDLIAPEKLWVTPKVPSAHFDPNYTLDDAQIKQQIPAILKGYFSIKCQIAGYPTYDDVFDVDDFYIMLAYSRLVDTRAIQRLSKSALQ